MKSAWYFLKPNWIHKHVCTIQLLLFCRKYRFFCFQVAPQVNLNQNLFFWKCSCLIERRPLLKGGILAIENFMYRNISVFWKPFLSNLWRTTDAHWTQTQKYTNSFETYQRIWGAHHLTNPLYEQFWSVLWCKLFVFESTKCWQE